MLCICYTLALYEAGSWSVQSVYGCKCKKDDVG